MVGRTPGSHIVVIQSVRRRAWNLSGPDRKLASYIRGLLYEARHDHPAAETAFPNAIWSPSLGHSHVNVELARVLLAEHRPSEAVPVLRAALHGGI